MASTSHVHMLSTTAGSRTYSESKEEVPSTPVPAQNCPGLQSMPHKLHHKASYTALLPGHIQDAGTSLETPSPEPAHYMSHVPHLAMPKSVCLYLFFFTESDNYTVTKTSAHRGYVIKTHTTVPSQSPTSNQQSAVTQSPQVPSQQTLFMCKL